MLLVVAEWCLLVHHFSNLNKKWSLGNKRVALATGRQQIYANKSCLATNKRRETAIKSIKTRGWQIKEMLLLPDTEPSKYRI